MFILEQFKAYILGGIAVLFTLLSLLCWYQASKITDLRKDITTLELAVATKAGLLESCYKSIEDFNKAQGDISKDANKAVEDAKKSSKNNYESSREFGSKIPKTADDHKNTTDLFNSYIAKRQSESVK